MARKIFDLLIERKIPGIQNLIKVIEKNSDELNKNLLNKNTQIDFSELKRGNVQEQFFRISGRVPNHSISRSNRIIKSYKGIYVWGIPVKSKVVPIYFGISQNLATRIVHHLNSNNKSIANLAHLMSQPNHQKNFNSQLKKDGIKLQITAKNIPEAQEFLKNKCVCSFFLVENDYEMYLLEVFSSIKHKSFWNIFQTH